MIDTFWHIGPGWDCDWLRPAISKAKESNSKLLAETLSRLIRSRSYHSVQAPDAQPSDEQLIGLREMSEGVILVTALDSDAPAGEERAYQTRRGQEQKNKRGGRPKNKLAGYKLARRREHQARVRALRAQGLSLTQISEITGLPRTTVRDWVRNPGRILRPENAVDASSDEEFLEFDPCRGGSRSAKGLVILLLEIMEQPC